MKVFCLFLIHSKQSQRGTFFFLKKKVEKKIWFEKNASVIESNSVSVWDVCLFEHDACAEWNNAIVLLQSWQPSSWKDRQNICLLPDSYCLAVWKFLHRNTCLQDENHEEKYQLYDCEHGDVWSAFSDFRLASNTCRTPCRLLAYPWRPWWGIM